MDIIKKELDSYDGHKVTKITLINDNGVEISCLTMGAIWQEFLVPVGNSKKNMLLGFEHSIIRMRNASANRSDASAVELPMLSASSTASRFLFLQMRMEIRFTVVSMDLLNGFGTTRLHRTKTA